MGATVAALNKGIPAVAVSAQSGDPRAAPIVAALIVKLVSALATAADLSFAATRIGDSANAGLQFYEHLGDSPVARGYGIPADQTLPGVSLEIPASGAGYADDASPRSESNALKAGVVTVSVIQGTYAADDRTASAVTDDLRSLFPRRRTPRRIDGRRSSAGCISIQPLGIMGAMNVRVESKPPPFGHGLNPEQLQAATFGTSPSGAARSPGLVAGPLLIIAGAGTGKTNTLAHRVAWLLLQGVAPQCIALLTFTRRASQELLQRAERIARAALAQASGSTAFPPNATRAMWSGTFHSVGNRLLREYAHVLGLDPAFSVVDRGDAADLIDLKRQELGLAGQAKRFPRKDTCLAIYSHRVNTRGTLAETLESEYPWCAEWRDELTRLFRAYVEAKQAQQLLDYDDLLLYWHVLAHEPAVARELGARFEHVLVDEYQDTNTLQAEILLAMKPEGAGLCVVGDDAQSIYSFRAATVDNILDFPARFVAPADVITLDRNYRSLQPILDAANVLMAESVRRYHKQLQSGKASAQKPWYVTVEDDRQQSLYVVEQVLAKREQGTPLRQQAVLMRSAHHSDVLEVELIRRNIPYVKYGGLKFLEAAHVKDVLALLRWIDNPRNRLAGFRVLQLLPGIGPATADRCLGALEEAGFAPASLRDCRVPAAAQEDWRTLVDLVVELHGARAWAGQMTRVRQWYEPHLERAYDAARVRRGDLEQLELIAMQSPSRERFVTELTLDPPRASGDESGAPLKDEDYLILSTVHSAKGQEWDSVFVLNVTDGSFPNEFATGKPAQVEEERRLLYVAITRARQDLHLVAPLRFYVSQQHRWGDKHVYGARSRFMTPAVLGTFESRVWPSGTEAPAAVAGASAVRIDASSRLLGMWED